MTTRPGAVEVAWFAALCDDDYEFLGVADPALRSSWEHCRDIGRPADGWLSTRSEVVADDTIPYEGYHHGSSYLEHVDFRDAIRSGSAPVVSPEDGLLSVALGVAAHRSIDERRPVDVAEVLAS